MQIKNLAQRLAEKFNGKYAHMEGNPESRLFRAEVNMPTKPDIEETVELLNEYYEDYGFKQNGSLLTYNRKGEYRYSTITFYENLRRLVIEGREY
jgi:hypothetical protein